MPPLTAQPGLHTSCYYHIESLTSQEKLRYVHNELKGKDVLYWTSGVFLLLFSLVKVTAKVNRKIKSASEPFRFGEIRIYSYEYHSRILKTAKCFIPPVALSVRRSFKIKLYYGILSSKMNCDVLRETTPYVRKLKFLFRYYLCSSELNFLNRKKISLNGWGNCIIQLLENRVRNVFKKFRDERNYDIFDHILYFRCFWKFRFSTWGMVSLRTSHALKRKIHIDDRKGNALQV